MIKNTKTIKDTKVFTDIGWIDIDSIHLTKPFRKYIVLFESGREIECADTHCFILNGYQEKHAKDLNIGDTIISDDVTDVVFDVFDTGIDEEMYDITLPYHHLYFTNGVLSHNSNIMSNIISRQIQNGVKVGLASLEMSEDMYAQRFDANLTNLDINRIYINRTLKGNFIRKIKEIKSNRGDGALYLKEYPTGKATVNDFRIWLRELGMRDMLPDIFFCDYISLMKSESSNSGDLYKDGKAISEELRALGFEFKIPVVTVAQINRAGTFLDFDDLDTNSIGECLDPKSILNKKVNSVYTDIYIKNVEIGDVIKGSKGDVTVKGKSVIKKKKMYKIKTKTGKVIICSEDHKHPTNNGIKTIKHGLKIHDKLNSFI